MTVENLNEVLDEITEEERKKWETNKALSESGEMGISKYDDGYIEKKVSYSRELTGSSLDDVISILTEEKERLADLNHPLNLSSDMVGTANDEYEAESIFVKSTYSNVATEDFFKSRVESRRKAKIVELVYGRDNPWKSVSCQLFGLFKEGSIDWDTLVRISNENCKV